MERIKLSEASGKESLEAFREDVLEGLSQPKKIIPHRYCYEGQGGAIFQWVLENGDNFYSLPFDEVNLLKGQANDIVELFGENGYNLIDLGAGDGKKTKVLIEKALEKRYNFEYVPIDYSSKLAEDLSVDIETKYPNVKGKTLMGDMSEGIKWIKQEWKSPNKNIFMNLGGTFGNYQTEEIQKSVDFISKNMKKGDLFCVTLWMLTDPFSMQQMYSNNSLRNHKFIQMFMPVFKKINEELGANFDLNALRPHAYYDPYKKYIEVCAVSLKKQEVTVSGKTFIIEEGEAIELVISRRWTIPEVKTVIKSDNLEIIEIFENHKGNTALICFEKQ